METLARSMPLPGKRLHKILCCLFCWFTCMFSMFLQKRFGVLQVFSSLYAKCLIFLRGASFSVKAWKSTGKQNKHKTHISCGDSCQKHTSPLQESPQDVFFVFLYVFYVSAKKICLFKVFNSCYTKCLIFLRKAHLFLWKHRKPKEAQQTIVETLDRSTPLSDKSLHKICFCYCFCLFSYMLSFPIFLQERFVFLGKQSILCNTYWKP